jgi:hypothetical protein
VLTSKSAAKANAGVTVEWVVWQMPAARSGLPQGVAAGSQPSNVPGARQDAADEDGTGAGGFTGAGVFGGTVGVGVGSGASFGATGEPAAASAPQFPSPTARRSIPPTRARSRATTVRVVRARLPTSSHCLRSMRMPPASGALSCRSRRSRSGSRRAATCSRKRVCPRPSPDA